MTEAQVRRLLAEKAHQAGSRAAFAREIGVSSGFLGLVIMGKRIPSPKILDSIGVVRTIQSKVSYMTREEAAEKKAAKAEKKAPKAGKKAA